MVVQTYFVHYGYKIQVLRFTGEYKENGESKVPTQVSEGSHFLEVT